MYIAFENELGKINLNGGVWRIKEIEGIGLLEKTCSIVTYPDVDGQELLSAVSCARYITMSGDVIRYGSMKHELSRAVRILNKPGILKIQVGSKKRKIYCRCSSFSGDAKEKNEVYQSFVMQIIADYPYFEDYESKKISLFSRENLISDTFTLPCLFSERNSRRRIVNAGDVSTVPAFYVICGTVGTAVSDYGFGITNHTTGQEFRLIYKMSENEEINVNLAERTITSNMPTAQNNNGNLLSYISEYTFLSDFCFDTGVNDVECINYDTGGEIGVIAEYSNKYIEAVAE